MSLPRPGLIAARAVNQYRKRDLIGYLATRYLLGSVAAKSDKWAFKVATDLVVRRSEPAYFISHHFKGESDDGSFVTRAISIPSPLEVLAETALLARCSVFDGFKNPAHVYTYELSSASDRSGSFVNYWDGLRRRQRDIASICTSRMGAGVVRYLDIKKFYPSIRTEDLRAAWRRFSVVLDSTEIELGDRLIDDHAAAGAGSSCGLLTGPMFSHLLANLVMRDIDDWAENLKGVKYLRYVDDITLIGDEVDVNRVEAELVVRLASLNLELHDGDSAKSLTVSAKDWLSGRNDFDDQEEEISWKALIGDMKRFLLAYPEKSQDLRAAFLDSGMRLPVYDYAAESRDASYVEVVRSLARSVAFRVRAQGVSVASLILHAARLRDRLRTELDPLVDKLNEVEGYEQKRLIPRLRFRAGRLVYLAETGLLRDIAAETSKSPDLRMHSEIMNATASRDVTAILTMGNNAVQSAAQPLRSEGLAVRRNGEVLSEVECQGLAVLHFNGLEIDGKFQLHGSSDSSDLLGIAKGEVTRDLMNSDSPFIRELSSLVGLDDRNHASLLTRAFDESDELILDAVDRLEESVPFGG